MNSLALFNPRFTSNLLDAMDKSLVDFFPSMDNTENSYLFSAPKVDVREEKDNYLMEMDLPGLTEKDVEINLKDRILTISSKKEEEKNENKKKQSFLIHERTSYSFTRRFTLPEDINAEAVSANFKNGVLSVNIPRKALSAARTITITPETAA